MKQLRKRFGFGLFAGLSLLTMVLAILPAPKVHADGETYTWKDYNTIIMSGGEIKSPVEFKLVANSNPQRFLPADGKRPTYKDGCDLDAASITISNDTSGTIDSTTWDEYQKQGPSYYPANVTWCWAQKEDCTVIFFNCHNVARFPGVPEKYEQKSISIGGTRPGSDQQSESELDREVVVVINSPNPNSSSASSIGIQIKDANNQVIASANPTKEPALGSDKPGDPHYVDPNYQPVYYLGDFHLDPGKYIVCADIVIADCRSFEKVKFKSLHLEFGDDSTKRVLTVKVHVRYTGGIQDMTIDPFTVNVTKPSGETVTLQTNGAEHKMTNDEKWAQGGTFVTYEFWPYATFNGIDPGTYDVCVDGVPDCQKVEKKVGEPAEVTFEVDWNAFNADNKKETDCKDKYTVMGIKAVTYLICSVIDTGTYAVGALDTAISGLLTIDTKDIFSDTNQNNPYHLAWNSFRLFALGIVVIATLIMVVSQAARVNILDAYTIRKVLPRLLFAAIFIALSWDILEFLCNLSNDAGNGIRGLIYAPFRDIPHGGDIGGGSVFVLTLLGTGGALALGWIGLLSFVVTGILASLVAVAVLIVRKIFIILIILVAPFAIAAGVLPNTRKVYEKWKEALVAVLVVFPIIMSFIAIGRIFAIITFNAAENMSGTGGQTVTQIIAFIAYFAPYFMITFAFKLAGGVIATAGGVVNNRSKGAFDRLRNFRGNKVKENMGKMATGERFQGNNPLARAFNATTFGATTLAQANGRAGLANVFTKAGRARAAATRRAMLEQRRSLNSMKYADSPWFKAVMHNDPVLRAQTYANASEALANMGQDFGMSQDKVDAAVSAARANGGFSRDKQLAAVKQLFATGTGYDNLWQAVNSINRVAGSNSDMAMSIIGEGNFTTGTVGRMDLKVGFVTYADLYKKLQATPNTTEQDFEPDLDDAYVNAVKENDVNSMLRGKPRAVQNIAPALTRKLNAVKKDADNVDLSDRERDIAREEVGRLSGIIEQLQTNANYYASPVNKQTTEEQIVGQTVDTREAAQQQASSVELERDRNTGELRPRIVPAPNQANPNATTYVPNLGQDEHVARGYNQQRPRRPGQL